jgi:hypothetical protein
VRHAVGRRAGWNGDAGDALLELEHHRLDRRQMIERRPPRRLDRRRLRRRRRRLPK